jgi:ribonuclease HI
MIKIYFDGLCYPRNPGGVAAYGYLVYDDGKLVHRGFGAVGEGRGMTSNVAEYEGLKAAVQWIDDHEIKGSIEVKGDSQLVIKQMKGEWEVRSKTSQKYVPEISRLLQGKDVRYTWIPREMNEEADRLSRLAYEAYRKRTQRA